MNARLVSARLALLVLVGLLPGLAFVEGRPVSPPRPIRALPRALEEKAPAKSATAWKLGEALIQLEMCPEDPYLQYVALQLARRAGRLEEIGKEVARLSSGDGRPDRRAQVNLFDLFTGALAVQESLQLDTMLGARQGRPIGKGEKQDERLVVPLADLAGPKIKSHPWAKMLDGRKPGVSALSRSVPADFYLVEFRSVAKLLELIENGDLWASNLLSTVTRNARTQAIGPRLRQQLSLPSGPLTRTLGDTVIAEVGLTGSDLELALGSDVTVLFRYKQEKLFKSIMKGSLSAAAKAHPTAKRRTGKHVGITYEALTTPERDLHAFSAFPAPGIYVRSNSESGLRRVLEAIKGEDGAGKAVTRLGDTDEFKYVRTLMPYGASEEDGFIYLSDPFIRNLVGPRFRVLQRRRLLTYNHLRMIGHGAALHRTETGRAAASLEELIKTECCPEINKGELKSPLGGTYALSADRTTGVDSRAGTARHMVPCLELPLTEVSREEASQYRTFERDYSAYWQTFFDPIAVRVQVTPRHYRAETIVLPLLDNSVYTGLAKAFAGKPEALDALPVPKRNILSVVGRFDKAGLLKENAADVEEGEKNLRRLLVSLGVPDEDARDLGLRDFVAKGLGNQVGLHVYDSATVFDLDLLSAMGLALGNFNGGGRAVGSQELVFSFVLASLNSPVYVALPVQDVKVVDEFLTQLDKVLLLTARTKERAGFLNFEQDFYKAKLKNGVLMRTYGFRIGPVKWRVHWARIGGGLYVASKPFILEDLVVAEAARAKAKAGKADPETVGHVMLRMRPEQWDQVLAGHRLSWAENNRQASLRNLGPLASAGRVVLAGPADGPRPKNTAAERGKLALAAVEQIYGVRLFCPEGGTYELSADGKTASNTRHGTLREPTQELAPAALGGVGAPELRHVTATLTFLEEGLRAVLVLEKK